MEDPEIIRMNIKRYRMLNHDNMPEPRRTAIAKLLAESERDLKVATKAGPPSVV